MGVTVINGTNSMINTSISAGVNYDWRNQLRPKEYVVLGNTDVFVTLNTRWWVGENSEYKHSIAEIAMFALGTVIGVAGIILAIPTGGTSLTLTAAAIAGGSLLLGGVGLVVGGISIAIKDFEETKTSKTGVYLAQNPIFIVEGTLTFAYDKQVLTITGADKLQLRPLSPAEFSKGIQTQGWVETRPDAAETQPVDGGYYTMLNADPQNSVWIYPSYSGVPDVSPARWYINEGNPDGPLQLWNRTGEAAEWQIRLIGRVVVYDPKTSQPTNDLAPAYHLYNTKLDRYACVSPDEKDTQLYTKRSADNYCLFFIIKSGSCYAFVPVARPTIKAGSLQLSAVINENGGIGDGTRVLMGDRTGPHPGWARWVLDPVNLGRENRLSTKDLEALSDQIVAATVRIYPAVLRRHPIGNSERPACWGIEGDSTAEGAPLQLQGRDTKNVEWRIKAEKPATPYGLLADLFSLYCPALDRYATIAPDGFIRTTKTLLGDTSLFTISNSMGCLSFFRPTKSTGGRDWDDALYYDGVRLRMGPCKDMPTLGRWVVIPTTSPLAKAEEWKR